MDVLNVLDESGKVIGEATRDEIHQKGLLHGEVHVWFYTPDGSLIFQHRAKDKDTYPDLLDASVGGHVERGQTYEEAAVMEVEEEAGIVVLPDDLVPVTTILSKTFDDVTGKTNYARRQTFAYKFEGNVNDLEVEEGKALGFEAWPMDTIFNISDEDRKRFIPNVFNEETLKIFRSIKELL